MFSLELHWRKLFNAEASQLKERVNWKASRATSGAAYFCDVRISGVVDQVGTLLSGAADQVGNLELSWCRPGGTFATRSQLSCEVFFVDVKLNCRQPCSVFFLPCLMRHSQGCSHLSHLRWIRTQGCEQNRSLWHLWCKCSPCCEVILCSLDCSAEPNIFSGY